VDGARIAVETGHPGDPGPEEQDLLLSGWSAYTEQLLAHYEANPDFIAAPRFGRKTKWSASSRVDCAICPSRRTSFDWGC